MPETVGLLNGLLANYADEGAGLPSPYYTMQDSLEYSLGMRRDQITESFQNRAYCLWTAVLLVAYCGQREILEQHWLLISYISNQEVVADDANDLLLWNIGDNGSLLDTFPEARQSWADLQTRAQEDASGYLPEPLRNRRYLVPFWINAMPHRCTHKTVLSLLQA